MISYIVPPSLLHEIRLYKGDVRYPTSEIRLDLVNLLYDAVPFAVRLDRRKRLFTFDNIGESQDRRLRVTGWLAEGSPEMVIPCMLNGTSSTLQNDLSATTVFMVTYLGLTASHERFELPSKRWGPFPFKFQ